MYQHGSPFYDEDKEECMKMHRKAFRAFPVSRVYQAISRRARPATGCLVLRRRNTIRLTICGKKNGKSLQIPTRYYTTNLHRGAFMLPKYLEDMLEDEEDR